MDQVLNQGSWNIFWDEIKEAMQGLAENSTTDLKDYVYIGKIAAVLDALRKETQQAYGEYDA